MPTEKEKMLAGQLYNAYVPELVVARRRARDLTYALNRTRDGEEQERARILGELFGFKGNNVLLEPPFYCDYGENIYAGDNVFFNFNCVVLDVARVDIGAGTLFGPNVQIYTATHPIEADERKKGLEAGKPIRIGVDCWIGGSAVINPGVTIGDRTVIGSGSVVTKDIPAGVFAAGNPCRVIRQLE